MSIIRKVKAIERIFERLESEIQQFQAETSLHCLTGCGKCCTKPDIEASPLEFLPLAFEWFQQGIAHQKMELLMKEDQAVCQLYAPFSTINAHLGSCSLYSKRGLICRLFGYAASKDKNGQIKLVTCKLIKENQVDHYKIAMEQITNGNYVPIFSDYYKQLMQIDFRLGNQILPINQAIIAAIEEVLSYYAYRPFRIRKAG